MILGMGCGKQIAEGLSCVPRLALLITLLCGGCFFTSDINTAPTAEIEIQNPGPVHVHDSITVDAFKSKDADNDSLTFDWLAMSCDSAMQCGTPYASLAGASREFSFPVNDKRLITVSLTVFDRHGAHAVASIVIVPENRSPELTLQLQAPPGAKNPDNGYTIGRKLTFAAMGVDPDGDTLQWGSWLIDAPVGSQMSAIDLQAPDPMTRTFRPDVPGTWTVTVSVDDGSGPVSKMVLFTADPDEPPCIAATDPAPIAGASYIVTSGGGPRAFSIETVTDDLDPYPIAAGTNDPDLGGAHFRWWIAGPQAPATFVEVPGHDLHSLAIDPAAYAPGDTLAVRAEITDRVMRTPSPSCTPDSPTCSITGDPSCLQRVTWSLEIR
jgi:hypothetical protein